MQVTEDLLRQVSEAAEKATPGPYRACGADREELCSCGQVWSLTADGLVATAEGVGEEGEGFTRPQQRNNAAYIALMNPETAKALCQEVRTLKRALENISSISAGARHGFGAPPSLRGDAKRGG